MRWIRSNILQILIAVILLGGVCFLLCMGTLAPDAPTEPTHSVQTHSQATAPTAAPTTVPTEPNLDTVALVQRLGDATEEAVTEGFLNWLLSVYGPELLVEAERTVAADGYERELWYDLTGNTYLVLSDLYSGQAHSDENIHYISRGQPGQENSAVTMVFGGDICLADNYLVMEHMASTGGTIEDCIDPALIAEMRSADIAFLNNEFAISDRGEPMKGKMYTFRAKTENTRLYQQLGVDLVSLANNHAFDYGETAFLDTMDALEAHGITQIGGGKDLADAMQPQYYIVNGRKIAFVAATRAEKNIMTPAAGEDTPGVLRCYDTELFLQTIAEADQNSDFVVACVHWGTEYSEKLEPVQTKTAREYIDAGVDLIIGAHAHQLQGIEFYKGKAVFYNLGNFWFNSYEIDTGLVKVELDHAGDTTFTFLPALQSDCVTTGQVGTDRGAQILKTLEQWSVNVSIDENGVITEAE